MERVHGAGLAGMTLRNFHRWTVWTGSVFRRRSIDPQPWESLLFEPASLLVALSELRSNLSVAHSRVTRKWEADTAANLGGGSMQVSRLNDALILV